MSTLITWRSATSILVCVAAGAVVSRAHAPSRHLAHPTELLMPAGPAQGGPPCQLCSPDCPAGCALLRIRDRAHRRIHRTCPQAARLLRLKTRWRLRTLPGPRASPLLGNLPAIVSMKGGYIAWRDAMFRVYGKVYKVRAQRRQSHTSLQRLCLRFVRTWSADGHHSRP